MMKLRIASFLWVVVRVIGLVNARLSRARRKIADYAYKLDPSRQTL